MRHKRVILSVAGAFAILIGLSFGYSRFILDWNGRPISNAQLRLAFVSVMHEPGVDFANDPKPFPNVNGSSQESLATLKQAMGGKMDWATNYNYIPGLRENDPGALVLMYFNRPTRWRWFAVPPTIFQKKEWIIIPVDFATGMRPRSEKDRDYSERVSFDEFRRRLRQTLEYIRTNDRPNCQTIVTGETHFLDSLTKDSR